MVWVIHIPKKNNVRFIWDVAKVLHIFAKQLTTHTHMKNTVTTESICNEIETLIYCPKFRAACIEVAKKVGITPKEWNENKVNILYMFATKVVCSK